MGTGDRSLFNHRGDDPFQVCPKGIGTEPFLCPLAALLTKGPGPLNVGNQAFQMASKGLAEAEGSGGVPRASCWDGSRHLSSVRSSWLKCFPREASCGFAPVALLGDAIW